MLLLLIIAKQLNYSIIKKFSNVEEIRSNPLKSNERINKNSLRISK